MATVKRMRKNGGFVWHYVYVDGAQKGIAMCGERTNPKQRKSYWRRNSNLVNILGKRECEKCGRLYAELSTDLRVDRDGV